MESKHVAAPRQKCKPWDWTDVVQTETKDYPRGMALDVIFQSKCWGKDGKTVKSISMWGSVEMCP